MTDITRSQLEDNLLLFYTGVKRSASAALASEGSINLTPRKQIDNLSKTRAIGYETRDILLSGDMTAFGQILTNQWKLKYQRQPSALHDEIDSWIQSGIAAGAQGGKLVGAGGGGFLFILR